MQHRYRTWIDISKTAIANNFRIFKKLLRPKVKLLGVVKSNAYGHELIGFAKTLESLGVDWLGVDSFTEALSLRKEGIKKPILVQGYTLPIHFISAFEHTISLTISTLESLKELVKVKKNIKIHLKLETGMNRQGLQKEYLAEALKLIKKSPHIILEGVFTHFGAAKRPEKSFETKKQIEKFKEMVAQIMHAGFKPILHACATAGVLNFPDAHFDLVRVGIGLYGLWPSPETYQAFHKKLKLKPVLSWKAIVSEVKWVEKKEKIGYDYTEVLTKRTRLAVIPVGYWHGYWRAFSSRAFVLIGGKKCKVMGRVSMDMIVVDVTNVKNIRVGDEATLLGSQGSVRIAAEDLATLAGTTNYEIVTRLNPLIKKNYF